MVKIRSTNKSPIVLLLLGIIFIAIGIAGPFLLSKESLLTCNETGAFRGFCFINEKGIMGQTIKKFPANQVIDIYTKEHENRKSSKRGSSTLRNRPYKERITYTYSIHIKLSTGEEIQFPSNISFSASERDQMLSQLNMLKTSKGLSPVHLTHDSRFAGMIFGGVFGLIGFIMIIASFLLHFFRKGF